MRNKTLKTESPFKRCPKCGTPDLEDAPHALVLYFVDHDSMNEFKALFEASMPGATAHKVKTPEEALLADIVRSGGKKH